MGGGGGGFFTFALAAVGAIIGAAMFAPAVIPSVSTLVSASGVTTTSVIAGSAASGLLGATSLVGSMAVGAGLGMVAGNVIGGLTSGSQSVPDTQMPSFSAINYKDGLDTVSENAVEAPTYEAAASEAARKLDAEKKGVGYADTVLTATTDIGKASTKKTSLLGG